MALEHAYVLWWAIMNWMKWCGNAISCLNGSITNLTDHIFLCGREIWSSFCIHSCTNFCGSLLSSFRICWYVLCNKIIYLSNIFRCSWDSWCNVSAGAGGLSFLQFCNLNSFRTKFILGFSFFMGLSVPQYFNEYTSVAGYGPVHTGARWVHIIIVHILNSCIFIHKLTSPLYW